MMIDSLHVAGGGAPDHPRSLANAAKQFEALLIAQLLKSVRESGSGDWTGERNGPMSSIQEIAEQSLAEVLASQGGLGLAALVVARMETQRESQEIRGPAGKSSSSI